MKPITTRTIGPLHLEDLEPHRFEDLVRQLIYEFRDWQQLEATGRTGADQGFDARGTERRTGDDARDEPELEDETPIPDDKRVWLIQCKREKSIGPKGLENYLADVPGSGLHGIIFAAACDFSVASREVFRNRVRGLGMQEGHLWGKGEIEDMLFQPKNDHLLFAYFGISLLSRRRSVQTAVRSKLAIKRKLNRLLPPHEPIVVRHVTDDRYPWLEKDETLSRYARGRWFIRSVEDLGEHGLLMKAGRFFACIGDNNVDWDFAELMNDAISDHQDHWDGNGALDKHRMDAAQLWGSLPESQRAWLELTGCILYENIIDIDEVGGLRRRELRELYVSEWDSHWGPYSYTMADLKPAYDHEREPPDTARETRVQMFQRKP